MSAMIESFTPMSMCGKTRAICMDLTGGVWALKLISIRCRPKDGPQYYVAGADKRESDYQETALSSLPWGKTAEDYS